LCTLVLLLTPFAAIVVLWNALTTAYAPHNKERTLRRILGDCTLRYSFGHLNASFLVRGTTLSVYLKWKKTVPVNDELGEDARLL
jgi:hypothetical protein